MAAGVDLAHLVPEQRWECARCDHTDVTHEPGFHVRFHTCSGIAGMTAPMVPAGTRCDVRVHEREDYIGGEDVQYDGNGRPVAAVEIIRDDGNDVAVYAPTAHMRGDD